MAHRKYVKHIKRIRHCLLAVTFMFAPQSVAQAVAQEKPKAKHASISTILRAVVGIRSKIPKDAISAQTLGTEREGSGVVIDSTGLILTVGYLVLEASEIVVTRPGGRKISAKLIGYDSVSGLSLIKGETRFYRELSIIKTRQPCHDRQPRRHATGQRIASRVATTVLRILGIPRRKRHLHIAAAQ
jgi:S1-C subfamily serine protease